MSDYCIVCAPRSGSYYLMEYMCKTFNLAEGNEWFGRNKAVNLSKPFELKQTRLDIDWTVNEDLLTPEDIQQEEMDDLTSILLKNIDQKPCFEKEEEALFL